MGSAAQSVGSESLERPPRGRCSFPTAAHCQLRIHGSGGQRERRLLRRQPAQPGKPGAHTHPDSGEVPARNVSLVPELCCLRESDAGQAPLFLRPRQGFQTRGVCSVTRWNLPGGGLDWHKGCLPRGGPSKTASPGPPGAWPAPPAGPARGGHLPGSRAPCSQRHSRETVPRRERGRWALPGPPSLWFSAAHCLRTAASDILFCFTVS